MNAEQYFEGVKSYTLLAKKEVGQNFLINASTALRIVDALEIKPKESVLEIGFGAGSLTYFLAQTEGKIEGIDIDEAMIAKCTKDFEGKENLNLHQGNAMKFDYSFYDKIIGNLPYYITSGILEKVLLGADNCKKAVFMLQKEAVERIFAKPNTKDYGPLNVLLALSGSSKRLFNVPKNDFTPMPHVDSAVFEIVFKEGRSGLKECYALANALFLNRRKTVLNNLKNFLKDGDLAKNTLVLQGISLTKRPEELLPEDYYKLSESDTIKGRLKSV